MKDRRLTYRFVFHPETIGAIAYLHARGPVLKQRMVAGYVITCVGLQSAFTLKKSRRGDTDADRAALHVLKRWTGRTTDPVRVLEFWPSGSDERQYCSPGFDLPVASIMRTMYGAYPEYHTSLDNKQLVSMEAMAETTILYFAVCRTLDFNRTYVSLAMSGEPQLGKRGLYNNLGGFKLNFDQRTHAIKWLLNYCDGKHTLLDISINSFRIYINNHRDVSGNNALLPSDVDFLFEVALQLCDAGLLHEA